MADESVSPESVSTKAAAVRRAEPLVLLAATAAVLIWSGLRPHDRFLALSGALIAQLLLARVHERQLSRLGG